MTEPQFLRHIAEGHTLSGDSADRLRKLAAMLENPPAEAVARAIAASAHADDPELLDDWTVWIDEAHAAIAAMWRKP